MFEINGRWVPNRASIAAGVQDRLINFDDADLSFNSRNRQQPFFLDHRQQAQRRAAGLLDAAFPIGNEVF